MKRASTIFILLLLALSLVIFLSRDSFVITSLQGYIQKSLSAPLSIFYNVINSRNINFSYVKELEKENQRLKKMLINQKTLIEDNKALRGQFESTTIKVNELLPVRVVGRKGIYSNPSRLIIDSGEADGIRKGFAAIYENNLIGMVYMTTKHFSEIILLNAKEFSTIGKISTKDTMGVVRGEEDFTIFDNIAITEEMKEGDTIYTKGDIKIDGTGIPSDLIIGTVNTINKAENRPFQSALITPGLNFSTLTHLFIVKL